MSWISNRQRFSQKGPAMANQSIRVSQENQFLRILNRHERDLDCQKKCQECQENRWEFPSFQSDQNWHKKQRFHHIEKKTRQSERVRMNNEYKNSQRSENRTRIRDWNMEGDKIMESGEIEDPYEAREVERLMEEIKKVQEQNMQLYEENMNLRLRKLRMFSSTDGIQVLEMKKQISDLKQRMNQRMKQQRMEKQRKQNKDGKKFKTSVCLNSNSAQNQRQENFSYQKKGDKAPKVK